MEGKLASLLEAHVHDLRVGRRSQALEDHARLVLPRFFEHMRDLGVSDVRAVTEAHVVSYGRSLLRYTTRYGTLLSVSSRSSFLAAVKRFFAFLAKRGLILQDPAREIRCPRERTLPRRVLSEAQARRLMAAPFSASTIGIRDRAILEVLYGTGIRLGECQRLELGDYDAGQKVLCIRSGKGKKDRYVPVPARAAVALDLSLRESRPDLLRLGGETALFLSRFGARGGKDMISLMVRKHARAAGIEGPVSAHVLRHSCATHLLKGGADVRHVQKLLGHSTLDVTARYTKVAISDLKDVVRRSHPRERGRPR